MPDDGTVQTPSHVRYLNGVVELAEDRGLVLDFTPEAEPGYWNWVLQNVWGETLDWRDRPVVLNNRDVARGPDGRIRIVVAHRNPELGNREFETARRVADHLRRESWPIPRRARSSDCTASP